MGWQINNIQMDFRMPCLFTMICLLFEMSQPSNIYCSVHSLWKVVFKIIHNINCPQQLENYLLKRSAFHTRDFRDSTLLNIVATKTKMGQTSFKCTAAGEWNLLPKDIQEIQSLSKFKAIVFEYFLEHDKSNHLCSLK